MIKIKSIKYVKNYEFNESLLNLKKKLKNK